MYLPPNPDIFAIQFGGIIENISIELDMASRTKIMNLIDEARKAGKLTRDRRYNRNSFFKFDVNSFKIVTDDNKQDVLVRMPIYQVACFSYVYEDDQHIIAIKYGEVDMKRSHNNEVDEELICRLIICFCDSKQSAEQLCSFAERCFSELFNWEASAIMTSSSATGHNHTRSTSLTNNNNNNNNHNNNNNIYDDGMRLSSADSLNGRLTKAKYSFLSNSCLDVRDPLDANGGQQLSSIFYNSSSNNNNNKSDVTNDVINQGYVSASDSSQLSMKEQELIRDYMRKLYNVLTNFELESFAQLVKSWQRDIPFHDFMNQLLQLYGEKRKYLLKEMRPFIPTKDIPYYESFLSQHQLTDDKK